MIQFFPIITLLVVNRQVLSYLPAEESCLPYQKVVYAKYLDRTIKSKNYNSELIIAIFSTLVFAGPMISPKNQNFISFY